ncbi:hypothetical protein [Microbispora sitophila]|nr:hypothetical protein [Microbispora sitophila]
MVLTCHARDEDHSLRIVAEGRLMATSVPEVVAWPTPTPSAAS